MKNPIPATFTIYASKTVWFWGFLTFIADCFLPQGASCAIFYALLLLFTAFNQNKSLSLRTSVVFSLLLLIALWFKNEGNLPHLFSSGLALAAIWLVFLFARIIRQSQERYNAIWRQNSAGLILVNSKGEIVQTSPAIHEFFGYEESDLQGKPIEILIPNRMHQQHQQHRKQFHANPNPRGMGVGLDLLASRKDGSEFPVEISLSPFHSEAGDFVIVFVVDNTVRKKLEQTLIGQKRTDDILQVLNKSLEKERELSDLKSSFVSMASHEFRTPLTSISSSADLIAIYTERKDLEKIKKHGERIKNSVENLTAILSDFLSLGKIEEGKITANLRTMNLPELVENVREELKYAFKSGQMMEYKHTGTEIVQLDPALLKNVLLNLISNAIKYSPENTNILVEAKVSEDMIKINIIDDGIGIATEDQKKLFERFFRAGNVNSIQGTGLGLYIVKKYVEMMGGNFGCTSKPGNGSTFWVVFRNKK